MSARRLFRLLIVSRLGPCLALLGCGGGGGGGAWIGGRDDLGVADRGAARDFGVAARGDLAAPNPCDPIGQNCPDQQEKCSFATDLDTNKIATLCVPLQGATKDGETCTRQDEMIGFDDCDRGLYCSAIGQLADPPKRKCRTFCGDDTACGAKGACLAVGDAGTLAGFCVPTCTPFGTECGANMTCADYHAKYPLPDDKKTPAPLALTCRALGAKVQAMGCVDAKGQIDPLRCAAHFFCLPTPIASPFDPPARCFAACDKTHACPMGLTCKPLPGAPIGVGYCE